MGSSPEARKTSINSPYELSFHFLLLTSDYALLGVTQNQCRMKIKVEWLIEKMFLKLKKKGFKVFYYKQTNKQTNC